MVRCPGVATDAKSNEITAICLTDTLIKCGGHDESVDVVGIHLIRFGRVQNQYRPPGLCTSVNFPGRNPASKMIGPPAAGAVDSSEFCACCRRPALNIPGKAGSIPSGPSGADPFSAAARHGASPHRQGPPGLEVLS